VTCTAKRSTDGQPCKNAAVKGSTVCGYHGGKAPQVRAAAARRLAEAQAAKDAADVYLRLAGEPPADPLTGLKELAARFHAIEADLFARIAADPGQMATLLVSWGAAASKYLDTLMAWSRLAPTPSDDTSPLAFTLNLGEQDLLGQPRALPVSVAESSTTQNGASASPEPPQPLTEDVRPLTRAERRRRADEAEREALAHWHPVEGEPGIEERIL
jgi:hypothetical protein